MSGRRDQLRDAQLKDPRASSTAINDTLRDLYARLEALEQTRLVDIDVTSGPGGEIGPVVLARPAWNPKVVYLAKMFDVTNNTPQYPTTAFVWTLTQAGISIPVIYAPAASTRYKITFHVFGGES